jgi:defect-in-organelle-trafficking protein DotB
MGTLVDLQKRPMPDDPELAGFLDTGLAEPPAFDPMWFDRLLLWAADHDVSDVTIQAGNFVFVERFGRLSPITRQRWSAAEAYGCAQAIYGDNAPSQLAQGEDIDCSYEIRRGRQDLARFRVNMTAARAVREWGLEITIRTIPTTPPTLDQLDLPTDLRAHLAFEQGLVIVTGPTGSGKTTLLGAIIRALLEQPDSHRKIIAYESPIEYVYDAVPRSRALIAQHEIGVHLQSFAAGVRNSLRRKPMVILVGESRDADTIDAMILAAQTGHLVYTTAHTNSVPETLTRLVEPFPVSEREGRLAGLLDSLRLIVTQRLVRTVDGRRAAAREYLHFTQAEKDRLAEVPFRQVARVARELVRQKGRPLTLDLHALHDAGRLSDTEFHHYREVGTQLDPLGGVAITRCADPSDPADPADHGDPHDGR